MYVLCRWCMCYTYSAEIIVCCAACVSLVCRHSFEGQRYTKVLTYENSRYIFSFYRKEFVLCRIDIMYYAMRIDVGGQGRYKEDAINEDVMRIQGGYNEDTMRIQ